jgi:hypothetical protein
MEKTVVSVPIAELIAAPLEAAIDAQSKLARSTVSYITDIGLEKGRDGTACAREVAFVLERPGAGAKQPERMTVRAPLLALIPIPSLAIEELNIDFQMEVTSTDKVTEKNESAENGDSALVVSGKVSSHAEHTRDTNQSAKYQIQVRARKQPPPEGLSRLLDVLAATVRGYDTEEK